MYRTVNSNVSSASSGSFKHEKKMSYFLKINEERMALVMSSLIDNEVEVNLENGNRLKGVFNSFDPASRGGNKAIDIAINSYVPTNGTNKNKATKPMIVYGNEYHFFSSHGIAKSLFKQKEQRPLPNRRPTPSKFKTDTEISSTKHTNINPVLTEWRPSESVDESQLVELDKVEGEQWDQFETNRNEYGVVSTFDENMYTTSLDLNDVPDSVKERAEKLAAEIENSTETSFSKVESLLEDEDAVDGDPSVLTRSVKDEKDFKDENDLKDPRESKRKEKLSTTTRIRTKMSSLDSVSEKSGDTPSGILHHIHVCSDKFEPERVSGPPRPKIDKHAHQIGINALNIEPTNSKNEQFKFGFSDKKSKYSLEQEKNKSDTVLSAPKSPDKQESSPHVEFTKSLPKADVELTREPAAEPQKDQTKDVPKEPPKEPKKSFKFNPNASTFTPTLVTAKTPPIPSEQSPVSNGNVSPGTHQQAKLEFKAFNPMKRFPKLDLSTYRAAETARFNENDVGYKWQVDGSLSYRDLLGDLTPLYSHHHHPSVKIPNHLVHANQTHVMMPPVPQMHYPAYPPGPIPVGMVQYGPQVHHRIYNGVPYNHMGPNPGMNRRGHPPHPRYGHASPHINDHYMGPRINDHYDDKHRGYGGHPKHKK